MKCFNLKTELSLCRYNYSKFYTIILILKMIERLLFEIIKLELTPLPL